MPLQGPHLGHCPPDLQSTGNRDEWAPVLVSSRSVLLVTFSVCLYLSFCSLSCLRHCLFLCTSCLFGLLASCVPPLFALASASTLPSTRTAPPAFLWVIVPPPHYGHVMYFSFLSLSLSFSTTLVPLPMPPFPVHQFFHVTKEKKKKKKNQNTKMPKQKQIECVAKCRILLVASVCPRGPQPARLPRPCRVSCPPARCPSCQ